MNEEELVLAQQSIYTTVPDVVELIGNSITLKRIAQKKGDDYKIIALELPRWFVDYLLPHFSPTQKQVSIKALRSVEDVRNRYRQGNENA